MYAPCEPHHGVGADQDARLGGGWQVILLLAGEQANVLHLHGCKLAQLRGGKCSMRGGTCLRHIYTVHLPGLSTGARKGHWEPE